MDKHVKESFATMTACCPQWNMTPQCNDRTQSGVTSQRNLDHDTSVKNDCFKT